MSLESTDELLIVELKSGLATTDISKTKERWTSIDDLDEATSALDNVNEKIVQDALDRARQGKTYIYI